MITFLIDLLRSKTPPSKKKLQRIAKKAFRDRRHEARARIIGDIKVLNQHVKIQAKNGEPYAVVTMHNYEPFIAMRWYRRYSKLDCSITTIMIGGVIDRMKITIKWDSDKINKYK